jgi:D-tyrosyl-tRNA(Tyr) deacylase
VIALVQRVAEASVSVGEERVGAIGQGLLALVAVERGDGEPQAERLARKVLGYRMFPDAAGKMNLSLEEVGGELLAVPQFTLAADTASGARPSFSTAALPADGERLFAKFVEFSRARARGRFGAHMRVSLVNDGPVTFWLRVAPLR